MRGLCLLVAAGALFDFTCLCEGLGLGLRTNSWTGNKLSANSRRFKQLLMLFTVNPLQPTDSGDSSAVPPGCRPRSKCLCAQAERGAVERPGLTGKVRVMMATKGLVRLFKAKR